MTNIQYRLPWGMTAKEAQEAFQDYLNNGGQLGYQAWLRKHRFLELVCEGTSASYADIRRLSDELFV